MDPNTFEASVPFLTPGHDKDRSLSIDKDGKARRKSIRQHPVLITSCFLFGNIIVLVLANWTWTRNASNFCALHTSQSWSWSTQEYSGSVFYFNIHYIGPVLKDVDIKYSTVVFNGSFFKDTIYRQSPSAQVDQAWRNLGIEYAGILVQPEEADRADISLDRATVNETNGGPGYPAIFEVFHQLHCLDLLRKSSYFNYEYYVDIGDGPFKHPEKQLKSHVGHCLDMIRQQLMCTADTGVHPFILVGNPPIVFPDFNREHKCKNFDDIREWAEIHQGEFDENALDHRPGMGELILDVVP